MDKFKQLLISAQDMEISSFLSAEMSLIEEMAKEDETGIRSKQANALAKLLDDKEVFMKQIDEMIEIHNKENSDDNKLKTCMEMLLQSSPILKENPLTHKLRLLKNRLSAISNFKQEVDDTVIDKLLEVSEKFDEVRDTLADACMELDNLLRIARS